MNFLAHALLSFDDPAVLAGNMISDFVKGKKQFDYPDAVQAGIRLHRLIDAFTDEHPATHAAKQPFRPAYRLYSGAIIDIIYDHFLANDETAFPGNSLASFSQKTYATLNAHPGWLSPEFRAMLPYMQQGDWLYNYRSKQGIGKSVAGLVRRASYLSESITAMKLLDEHYKLLSDCYHWFWKELKHYAQEEYLKMQA